MELQGAGFLDYLEKCESVEELKNLYRDNIEMVRRDQARLDEIEKQISELYEESRKITSRARQFEEDFSGLITRRIGEIVLSE